MEMCRVPPLPLTVGICGFPWLCGYAAFDCRALSSTALEDRAVTAPPSFITEPSLVIDYCAVPRTISSRHLAINANPWASPIVAGGIHSGPHQVAQTTEIE